MHLKSLIMHFPKLALFIMLWLTVSEVWVFEVEEFLRNFSWVRIFFDILIANISWAGARTPINHSIFWKSLMWTFRCIPVNCFNNLVFGWGQHKIVKSTFLDNLQIMTQVGNMETRKMTPIFSSTFSTLTVCNIFFLFENSQNLFWCGAPFGTFWSVKYLNFGQKLLIWTIHHTFLESRHPEVTKNPYYVLPLEWSQKRCQLMD